MPQHVEAVYVGEPKVEDEEVAPVDGAERPAAGALDVHLESIRAQAFSHERRDPLLVLDKKHLHRGTSSENTVQPFSRRTPVEPRWARAIAPTTARPMPIPGPSASRSNGWNRRSASATASPGPRSVTSNRQVLGDTSVRSSTGPAPYFAAFSRRLSTACAIRSGSSSASPDAGWTDRRPFRNGRAFS